VNLFPIRCSDETRSDYESSNYHSTHCVARGEYYHQQAKIFAAACFHDSEWTLPCGESIGNDFLCSCVVFESHSGNCLGDNQMTKKELIGIVAEETGVTKKDAKAVFNSIFSQIEKEMGNGGKVILTGFGTFETAARACHFVDGSVHQLSLPVFRAGENLKRICRRKS